MVATLDATIFVTVLALVSVTLFTVQAPDDGSPNASDVCDLLDGIELRSGLVAENSGNVKMNVWDIAAVSMVQGDTGFIEDYLSANLEGILGGRYGYTMTLEFRDIDIKIGNGDGKPVSECTRVMTVVGGELLTVSLTVY